MRPLLATTAALSLICSGQQSLAAESGHPVSSPENPRIVLKPQASPANGALKIQEGPQRSFHTLDGFYVRGSLGFSALSASFDDASSPAQNLDASGTGFGIDLLVGGSPTPGLAIGGGLISNLLFSADFERGNRPEPDRDMRWLSVGVFVDGFPDPHGGWHLGGFLGLASLGLSQGQTPLVQNTDGIGGAVWFGYDEWVAPDWSMGGLLRAAFANTSGEQDGLSVGASSASLTLMFSTLYH